MPDIVSAPTPPSKESPWKRLTRLFRSGPIVRHKIAAGERMQEPGGTARAYKKELSSLYVHSMASYGQYERLSRYADYSEMEFTPEIASAIDIYADETTSYDEDGAVLKIVSDDAEIKETLETLFFDILNVEFNIWSWVRNLCKYGDFILFVDASETNGILNLLPIPINEVEREEGYDQKDPFAVRFRWLTQGNTILENWQMIHFRLLGNDNFLPYGSSIIEPARRIWRQLILIEDAMLVYRIVRSPERRVFKIDVGNVPPAEIDSFMETIKTRLRRNQIVDPSSGRVDLRYNPLSVDEDYFIPVRGDKSSDISTLAGGQFTGDIDDVQYIQSKLFAALKVPKAYLGYEAELGSKATLAQQDVRFARTIERVQKILIAELNKIAIIHLFLLGYSGEDLVNFQIKMANSSTVSEQQNLELWRTKLEIAGTAQEGMLDRETIYRKIFKLGDEEIEKIREGKRADKLEDLTLEAMQAPPEASGGEAGAAGGAEPVPGEDELPTTLGGEEGGGAEATPEAGGENLETAGVSTNGPMIQETEGDDSGTKMGGELAKMGTDLAKKMTPKEAWDLHCEGCGTAYPWTSAFNPSSASCCESPKISFKKKLKRRNKGSEGNDASVAGGKGHDLFNPGTNLHTAVFGTEKQTASDPYDMRAINRLITRPLSADSVQRVLSKRIYLTEKSDEIIDRRLKDAIDRTGKMDEEVKTALRDAGIGTKNQK